MLDFVFFDDKNKSKESRNPGQNDGCFQENYNTPVEHTPGNPPTQLWKESLYGLLVKV